MRTLDVVLKCYSPTKGCAIDAKACYYYEVMVSMGWTTLFCVDSRVMHKMLVAGRALP